MTKVIVVIGPTGVGKTRLGVALAKSLDGEIISGDSMQIYKSMDIGTAKVTKQEMNGVIHHCIDMLDPTESYSVHDFQITVRGLIEEIIQRGKCPIIVGGTGLYIKAALYDYEFQEMDGQREAMIQKYQSYTNDELYHYLETIDAASAKELHPNNRQRVLRAIEIYETTGEKKSDMLLKQKHHCLYDAYFVGLTMDRDVLYERINQRVDVMIQQGLEQEVLQLYQNGLTLQHQSMKAIGYKEWFDYFEGHASLEEVCLDIKKHSRQYAKRQYTWFKNQFHVHWYDVCLSSFEQTIEEVLQDIKKWLVI